MTGRFTLDAGGRKVYVGSKVYYQNRLWLLEDIQYLAWNSNQYLVLQDLRNKNKKLSFISPNSVIGARSKETRV